VKVASNKYSKLIRWKGGEEKMTKERKSGSGYGLSLFPTDVTPEERKRKIFWLLFFVVVFCAQVWPIYMIGNRVCPLILGMPFSMAWIVLWIIIELIGLIVMTNQLERR